MSNEIDVERRRFLEVVATTVAATQFGVSALARSTLRKITYADSNLNSGTSKPFGSLKQIDAVSEM